jgi:hypothetical protein
MKSVFIAGVLTAYWDPASSHSFSTFLVTIPKSSSLKLAKELMI